MPQNCKHWQDMFCKIILENICVRRGWSWSSMQNEHLWQLENCKASQISFTTWQDADDVSSVKLWSQSWKLKRKIKRQHEMHFQLEQIQLIISDCQVKVEKSFNWLPQCCCLKRNYSEIWDGSLSVVTRRFRSSRDEGSRLSDAEIISDVIIKKRVRNENYQHPTPWTQIKIDYHESLSKTKLELVFMMQGGGFTSSKETHSKEAGK